MWFEGARLIVGDGSAPIENSAFLVEGNTFTWVGRQGEAEPPEGAVRVDLSGRTVVPALLDAHQHVGLSNVKAGTNNTENYTRENLVEHLERTAYHGGAATMSLGLEFDEALAVPVAGRGDSERGALSYIRSAESRPRRMRGRSPTTSSGFRRGAINEEEGRAAVQELYSYGVTLVKMWVDARGGSVPKIGPDVYRAIIDEAHANGMRGRRTYRNVERPSRCEGPPSGRDRRLRTHGPRSGRGRGLPGAGPAIPGGLDLPNLPGNLLTPDDLPWLSETLPPFEIERLREEIENRQAAGPDDPEGGVLSLQCRNLAKNHEAGMIIGMGTDSGGVTVAFNVAWTAHTEMRDMVTCGLSPMEAIMSATSVNAGILGLEDLGTVAEGKDASFMVLDANPLDDINNTRRISQVYLRGAEVDREALRAKFMDGVR